MAKAQKAALAGISKRIKKHKKKRLLIRRRFTLLCDFSFCALSSQPIYKDFSGSGLLGGDSK